MIIDGWVRVYLDDHVSGAATVRALNAIATARKLPTAWPESKPPPAAIVSGMIARRSVLVHPQVFEAWEGSRPKTSKKAVKKAAIRRKGGGTVRTQKKAGGDGLCRSPVTLSRRRILSVFV